MVMPFMWMQTQLPTTTAVVMGWTGSNSVGVNTNRTATLLFADGTTKSVNVTKDTVFATTDSTLTDTNINTGDIVSYRINSDDEYKLTSSG